MKSIRSVATFVLLFSGTGYCQNLSAQPVFEAASLKAFQGRAYPGMLQLKGGPGTNDPGRVTWGAVDLFELLTKAFDVESYRIVGLPMATGHDIKWFTLTATMPPDTTREQFRLMLRNFVIERFQIKLHHETRTYPGYDLVVAPGGPKLMAPANPDAPDPTNMGTEEMGKDGFLVLPPGHAEGIAVGNGTHAKFQNWTMAEFISPFLESWVQQSAGLTGLAPIMDKTGLIGKYDFTVGFDSRGASGTTVVGPQVRAGLAPGNDQDSGLADIFKALEKQLG